jgi:methyltransferase (TIGR00027 family)
MVVMSLQFSPESVGGNAARPSGDPATEAAPLRTIADTARWVALYRARESERADALFRDPLAARLAGAHGRGIATALPFTERNAWPFVTRTFLFDRMIRERLAAGANTVLNLAAGLDARPYRMELPRSLHWIEVDLPEIVGYKEEVLAAEVPRCRLERVTLDLRERALRRDLFARVGRGARSAVVLCEGLLIYMKRKEVATLAEDLAAASGIHYWLVDLASPGLLEMLRRQLGPQLEQAAASLEFAPAEGPGFFFRHGWKPVVVQSMFRAAARLKRVPLAMRWMALLPESKGRQGARPWSAAVLLKRR